MWCPARAAAKSGNSSLSTGGNAIRDRATVFSLRHVSMRASWTPVSSGNDDLVSSAAGRSTFVNVRTTTSELVSGFRASVIETMCSSCAPHTMSGNSASASVNATNALLPHAARESDLHLHLYDDAGENINTACN